MLNPIQAEEWGVATLLSKSAWAKISVFRREWHFSPSKCIYIGLLGSNSKSAPQLTPVPNFSSIEQKVQKLEILTWNDTKNSLMTSYLPPSDDVSKILWFLRDFVPEYHHAKFGCNWTTNRQNRLRFVYPCCHPFQIT